MLINCDRFFIEELQKNGYEVDYKKLTAIYQSSRKNPAYRARREHQRIEWQEVNIAAEQREAERAEQASTQPKRKQMTYKYSRKKK